METEVNPSIYESEYYLGYYDTIFEPSKKLMIFCPDGGKMKSGDEYKPSHDDSRFQQLIICFTMYLEYERRKQQEHPKV